MSPVHCFTVIEQPGGVAHAVRAEDMPPIRYHTGERLSPGDTVCGVGFFWLTDGVSLPERTAYIRAQIANRGTPVTCMACLGTVDE
jgi:hypothetical protein